jgi:uncharacterized protein
MTSRNIHRDLGYFYVGLIIAFSISGIFLNHRQAWHPSKYKSDVKQVTVTLPSNTELINDSLVSELGKELGFEESVRRFKIEKGSLVVSYEKHDLKVDATSGAGELITYTKVPVLAQMTQLHQDTSKWWIYYSDIFGFAMLVIAITGMLMIPNGKHSFKQRGWKLAIVGLIFPLIFLFLLS